MGTFHENMRTNLQRKMREALKDDIDILPTDMQRILIDDMVTAFINRAKVIGAAARKLPGYKADALEVHNLL